MAFAVDLQAIAGREWPCSRRTTKQRYELAAL